MLEFLKHIYVQRCAEADHGKHAFDPLLDRALHVDTLSIRFCPTKNYLNIANQYLILLD